MSKRSRAYNGRCFDLCEEDMQWQEACDDGAVHRQAEDKRKG